MAIIHCSVLAYPSAAPKVGFKKSAELYITKTVGKM